MRTPITNPFMPGADAVPEVWAGRVQQLTDWASEVRPRLLAGLYVRGRTILGEPGLGKSTLVNRIAEQARALGDWVTPQVRIPTGTDPLKAVAAAVLRLADHAGLAASRERRIADLLGRVRQVEVRGLSLSVDPNGGVVPHVALTELLVEVGEAAIAANQTVLIHLDEVQNITDANALSQLLIALGDASAYRTRIMLPGGVPHERHLPIAVYLTGLPEFGEAASSRTGATFSRRFDTTVLTPIPDDDLILALQSFVLRGWEVTGQDGGTALVRIDDDAARTIVELCQGEPFLFQLAGEKAWNAGRGDTVTREEVLHGWGTATGEAAAHVERILDRLSGKEREFVEVMAHLPERERNLTRIAQEMGYPRATSAGPFAQRLDTTRAVIQRKPAYRFQHRAIEAYLTTDWPEPAS